MERFFCLINRNWRYGDPDLVHTWFLPFMSFCKISIWTFRLFLYIKKKKCWFSLWNLLQREFLKKSYKLKKKTPYLLYKGCRSEFSLSLSKLALFKMEVLFRSTRIVRNLTYIFTFIMTNIAASSNIIFISLL